MPVVCHLAVLSFHLIAVLSVSVLSFIHRLVGVSCLSFCCFVLLFVAVLSASVLSFIHCLVGVSCFVFSLSCFVIDIFHCVARCVVWAFNDLTVHCVVSVSAPLVHCLVSVSVLYFYLVVLSFNLFTVLSASVLHFFTISCQCQFYIFILLFCRFILLLCHQCHFFHFHSLCLFSQLHFPSSELLRPHFTEWSLSFFYLFNISCQ